jgi:VanZ family protein
MVLPLRYARVWLIAGWVLVLVAIVLNIVPGEELPQVPSGFDKVEHVLGYAGLTTWFTGIYPRSRYLVVAMALFGMGIAIEWLQGEMNLGRARDYHDVIANVVGISAGISLALLWLGGWAQRLEDWMRERSGH